MGNVKIISASAGSGKTYRLAYEYVRSVVENPSLYRHILAVTFTNKATGEMSSRILERLHELATPDAPSPYLDDLLRDLPFVETQIRARARTARGNILHDYSRFAVLTIDRFFQRLIRSFMRELGVDGGFSLELETDSLLELAADALIDESATDAGVRERAFAAARDRLDEGKSWDIRGSLAALGSELFGEEYQRLPATATDPAATTATDPAVRTPSLLDAVIERAALAQTDMREKARQALAVIANAGLSVDDFKGRSGSVAGWLSKVAGGEFIPLSANARKAADSDDPAAWVAKTSPTKTAVEALIPSLRPLLSELENIYEDNRRLVSSARLVRENRHNFLLLADLQRHVERICREENIVPIGETNRMIARLLGEGDTPFIFERAGSYFTRFLVDEFQDTSQAQWENFVPLLRNAIASEEGSPVMLIGDVKQAIYRWRGSDWRILSRRVREQMGADRVEWDSLDTNYRSLRRVVEFNNMAVGRLVETVGAGLDSMLADARAEGALTAEQAAELTGMLAAAYAGHTQTPRSGADGGYVTLTVYDSDAGGDYTPPIIARIEDLQSRGFRPGEIAVLVRSNTQGARVARMLLAHKREHPSSPYCWDVVTAEALTVGGSAASRFIVACLSLASDSADTIQRAVFNRWLERPFDAVLPPSDSAFFSHLAALSPGEAFEQIVLRFGLSERTSDVAYIQAVHQQITSFAARSVADIPLFLKWWHERGAQASISMHQDAGAITVSTIHKSKGLQYRAVIIPWLSWSVGPDTRGRRLVVWAESSEGELSGAGSLPINFKESMSGSWFSERYFREQVLARIDAANLFYVAATRAESELHLMASSRDGRGTVAGVLLDALNVTGAFTEWGSPLHPRRDESGPESAAGTPEGAGVVPAGAGVVLHSYPTSRPGARVRLRFPTSRYTDDGAGILSPRDAGVSMHRAFEHASTVADIRLALDRMSADGLVSVAELARLRANVEHALENPLVAGWFSDDWHTVHNEGNIVLPRATSQNASPNATTSASSQSAPSPFIRRPDRVMVNDGHAVVVDYKFGERRSSSHAAQLGEYMRLLSEMGYTRVEGYIWYVSLASVEKIGDFSASAQ